MIRGAYDLGALSASDAAAPLYPRSRLAAVGGGDLRARAGGRVRTPDDDAYLYVLELARPLDRSGAIACDWRDGDVW